MLFSNISILQVLITLKVVGNGIETIFNTRFHQRLKIKNNRPAFLFISTSLLCSDCGGDTRAAGEAAGYSVHGRGGAVTHRPQDALQEAPQVHPPG